MSYDIISSAMMESAKRVLVHLTKEASLLQCARFVQGVTGHFAPEDQDQVMVNCGLDHNRFIISDRPFSGSRQAQLQRPAFCPIKNLTTDQVASLPEEIRGRGVDVGVAILLQSVNKRILLTRRSKELHIFPNVWVPPGGHMEDREQLINAGLRELQEETGLNLQGANLPWSILGLWESVFPPLLSRGLPTRHHIVTYLLVSSNETHQELQEKLQPDEREVSACAWLDREIAEQIVTAAEGEKDSGKRSTGLQPPITITEVSGRSLIQKDLALSTLLNTAPIEGEDTERVSTGTKYALELWLQTLR
ncbi:nucleoside diphosphate-linked moiety X motif 17 isoform X1 [Bufo gargarizans]|uniref:nucleoside diphosphate-linked moiety X motif 17 isoform X1 n=1 Tax=Bufo gargarizans TaxID=30331 RepID=UPI001CF2CFEC|nr:nucleoside diphosphate-linked moiety X motif 17 isoform X1 [Bufo gargarizans]